MPPQQKFERRKRGFTLIEMLLVVAVIAILAAILLPMGNKVFLKSKVATVKKSLKDFETAVDSYRQEYGRLPIPNGQDPSDQPYSGNGVTNIMLALQGYNGITNIPNPKKISFYSSDLVDSTGMFKDPWGHDITIYFDANYDNIIEDSATARGDFSNRTVAAISPGPDGKTATVRQREDDVSSLQRR